MQELIVYNYIMSTESIFFQDSSPYPNLEQYKEFCWQNAIEQYFQNYEPQQTSKQTPNQPSTLPIQPSIELSTLNNHHQLVNDQESTIVFTQIPFYTVSIDILQNRKYLQKDVDSSMLELQYKTSEKLKSKTKKAHKNSLKKQKTYNTTDYIIKQCFKALLSKEYISQVSSYCKEESVSYESLILFLKRGILKNKSKHIGVNHFYKFVIENDVFVKITKRFFVKYLWSDYEYYVLTGTMQNKEQYLACATKLMYIAKIESHERQQIEDAQNCEHQQ